MLGVGVYFGAHCLVFFISDAHRVVDVTNIKCRYDCCSSLHPFNIYFGCLAREIELREIILIRSRKLHTDNGNLPISIAHSIQKRKTCYNTQIWFDNNRYAKIKKSLPKAMYYPPKFPLIAFRLFSTISSSLTTRPPVSFCTSAAMASTRALSEPISDTYTPST